MQPAARPTPDPYSVLGVAETAGADEIRRAYRALAMRTHPDRPGGNAELFQQAHEAYAVLGDPDTRRRYDAAAAAGQRQQQATYRQDDPDEQLRRQAAAAEAATRAAEEQARRQTQVSAPYFARVADRLRLARQLSAGALLAVWYLLRSTGMLGAVAGPAARDSAPRLVHRLFGGPPDVWLVLAFFAAGVTAETLTHVALRVELVSPFALRWTVGAAVCLLVLVGEYLATWWGQELFIGAVAVFGLAAVAASIWRHGRHLGGHL